ncbi:hypothetical protein ACS0TY_016497 [Phlomoides rotata]
MEVDQFRVNEYSEIEQEKLNLINSTYKTLEQLENYKNETIQFEQQRTINQVQQRVFQQALQGAIGNLNSCLIMSYIYVPLVPILACWKRFNITIS